jgi:hypothetical protein
MRFVSSTVHKLAEEQCLPAARHAQGTKNEAHRNVAEDDNSSKDMGNVFIAADNPGSDQSLPLSTMIPLFSMCILVRFPNGPCLDFGTLTQRT